MIPEIASSHFSIVLAVGATGYIGVLHVLFWLWNRAETAHLWTSLFCVQSVVFQVARYIQVHTGEPDVAIGAARVQASTAALLVLCLIGFARTLRERKPGFDWVPIRVGAPAAVFVWISLFTPWVVPEVTEIKLSWTGQQFWSVPMSSAMIAMVPFVGAGIYYLCREVYRAPHIQHSERTVFLGFMAAYVAIAMASIGSAAFSPPDTQAVLSEFSPLMIAIGLNYVLVHRHRRLQSYLEEVVGTRTRELGDSEARYRALVDNSPLGVLACDNEGRVLAANPRILQILGVRSAPAQTELNLLTHPAVVELGLVDSLRECLETGEYFSTEITYAIRAGKRLDFRIKAAAVRDSRGKVTGLQVITEDIEDQLHLEEKLRQSQKMEAVGRLAAGIAHEINNPMAYVRSNLTMLEQDWRSLLESLRAGSANSAGDGGDGGGGGDDEEAKSDLVQRMEDCAELIEDSLEGVERTIAIVRDVKEFSHNSADVRESADVNQILENALRIASPGISERISIERMYGELPKLVCAPGQLQQVFVNLIVNAIQAVGESGTLWVISRRNEDEILVRVEDDGCGMSAHTLEHLFDPFFTTKPAGQGTGLGLYISYEIARMHGGDIHVMSTPEEGSAFEVRLPLSGVKLDRAR